jgi:hypothetical protein
MRLHQDMSYRWYEVSYKQHPLFAPESNLPAPFAIQDLGNDIYNQADRAAGPGMHPIAIDFGPVSIDDEDSGQFCDRWLGQLVKAYHGKLRPI